MIDLNTIMLIILSACGGGVITCTVILVIWITQGDAKNSFTPASFERQSSPEE